MIEASHLLIDIDYLILQLFLDVAYLPKFCFDISYLCLNSDYLLLKFCLDCDHLLLDLIGLSLLVLLRGIDHGVNVPL